MGFSQDIEVDGGINDTTIPLCLDSGANLMAVNSAIWHANDPEQMYYRLKAIVGN
jgi:ribulose-phosphate 3-epimerase